MSTKQNRKYGAIRKGAETSGGTNDSVFDKFLPPADAAPPESTPSTPPSTRARIPSRPSHPPARQTKRDAAPQRDFQRVANSITREALPAGMFNGKAKQLYDCLYSLTRGAIVPSTSVRISRAELMKKSDIGAKVTLEQNLRRLITAGLVSMKTIGGIQGGNEYTVHLPEEATSASTPPSTGTSQPSPPSRGENLGGLGALETSPPRGGVIDDTASISGEYKTSFKTKELIDDDEGFAPLLAAAREITGKGTDVRAWHELAELLAAELKIAAGHTTVSSPPAFLTEHLRRRLWKKEKRQIEAEAAEQKNATPAAPLDVSKCPDCFGTGMWYPEGYEKGVAKCRHERLHKE